MNLKTVSFLGLAAGLGLVAASKVTEARIPTPGRPAKRYQVKVGILQFGDMYLGQDNIPAISAWKRWIEQNSKFQIVINGDDENTNPIIPNYGNLSIDEIQQKGTWDDGSPNYAVYPEDLSTDHRKLIPKDTHLNFLFWNWQGKSPASGAYEFGFNQYGIFQPLVTHPIGIWWDGTPGGDNPQWGYNLTSVMAHEFLNSIFAIVNTKLGMPDIKTPERCTDYGYNNSNDPDWMRCRATVLNSITDEMYQAVARYIPT